MTPLFNTRRIRERPPRGKSTRAVLGRGWYDPWPPRNRDQSDPAVVASRLLATAGRMQTRLRCIARQHDVDPRVFRFLLLFSERKAPLRVADVATNMGVSHQTASRIVTLAVETGLVDLLDSSPLDGRKTAVRLTVAGRNAASRCLEALRADAAAIGAEIVPPRTTPSGGRGVRYARKYEDPIEEPWRYAPP